MVPTFAYGLLDVKNGGIVGHLLVLLWFESGRITGMGLAWNMGNVGGFVKSGGALFGAA